MSEEENLRKQISKARERVTRKIARLRREKQANVAHTGYDPRIDRRELESFSTQALKIVLHEYNEFTNRNVQFVGGRYNVPLRKSAVDAAKKTVEELTKRAHEWEENYGTIRLPTGDTVQHAKDMMGKRENANQSFSPFPEYKFNPRNFKDEAQMEEFLGRHVPKNKDEWEAESIKGNREHLRKIQDVMGESNEEFDSLTDFQFMMLWQGTNFLADKGIVYETFKALNDENVQTLPYSQQTVQDSVNELERLPKWASNLPPTKEDWFKQKSKQGPVYRRKK